jgi:hypothetical protein
MNQQPQTNLVNLIVLLYFFSIIILILLNIFKNSKYFNVVNVIMNLNLQGV